MCGIYLSIFWPAAPSVDGIERHALPQQQQELIERRGPSGSASYAFFIDAVEGLAFSSVLHMRGRHNVSQPLHDENVIFQWNGEVFGGICVGAEESDTLKLFSLFRNYGNVLGYMPQVQGPWAMSFIDRGRKRLLFGRDALGRRSLLIRRTVDARGRYLQLSSVALGDGWEEVPYGVLFDICLYSGDEVRWEIGAPVVVNPTALFSGMELHIDGLINVLERSVFRRIQFASDSRTNAISILFSGGVDCAVLACLAGQMAPPSFSVELVNVVFQPRTLEGYEKASDRIGSITALESLRVLHPHRNYTLRCVDVTRERYLDARPQIVALMRPSTSVMDLSICAPFWFASKAATSEFVLLGTGADELLGGYRRHRDAFATYGYGEELAAELKKDLAGIGRKNLGRDDRCISDNGKESRLPYLDEEAIQYCCMLPLDAKLCKLDGLVVDKYVLRKAALRLGLSAQVAMAPKKAIQFGSNSAKIDAKKAASGYQRIE